MKVYTAIDMWNSPPLQHHGVKGMKWGVRNDSSPSGQGRFPRRRTIKMRNKATRYVPSSAKRTGAQLKSASNTVLKTVSDVDRVNRLYNRAVKVGKSVAMSPAIQQYGALAVAGIAAHPAVALGVPAVAGAAILGYGVYKYSMAHDDLQDTDYLAHYGVKGMKWGVRKVREVVGNIRRRRAERRALRDERREQLRVQRNAQAIASGDSRRIINRMPKMTNEEIQVAINRLNMQEKVYQLDEKLNSYKAQEQSNTFFGKLMSNRNQQNNQNYNNNNQNKEKGIIGKAIDKQIENVVNNAAEAAVSSVISGNSFSETFRKKYGYKTTSEKAEESRKKYSDRYKMDAEDAKNRMNTLQIKNKLYNASSKKSRRSIKTGRDLYDADLEYLMSNVRASDLNKINFKNDSGEKKR